MKRRNKALSVTAVCMTAFLVACLGALHAIAQDLPTPPAEKADRAQAPTAETQTVVAQLSQIEQATTAGEAKEAEAVVEEEAESEAPEIQVDGDIITYFPLQDASIHLVFRQLAVQWQKNILTSKNVKGKFTADLFNVTFREALDSLTRVNGLGYIEEGNFIYVYTLDELEEIEDRTRPTETRVFTLHYIKPKDAMDLIAPCLSETGKVAATPDSDEGISPSDTEAGGMDYAVNDVLVVTDFVENLDEVDRMLKEADRRPLQVLIEATIMSVRLDEENSLGIDFAALDGVDLGNVTLSGANFDLANMTAATTGSGGLTFNWFRSDVGVFVNALETVSDVNVLANPKLLVLNRQRGEIIVGNEDGYFDTTTQSDVGLTQSVSFLKSGTRLVVRPFIGDNGYIRLEVHPEDSDATFDPATNLPRKNTTECTSNIIVKDGRTIMISGMFRENTVTGRSQVPLFGNIPVIGAAFRQTADIVEREEMVIMITPRIIKQDADDAISNHFRDDMERFRIGMRENLQWFGRSRMAVRHFNWAKDHLANGKPNRAMWDLNLALSLSPAMLEAIQYKEQLTGEAIWANEPRMSSTRWVVQSMVLNDIGANVNVAIPPARPMRPSALPTEIKDTLGETKRYDMPIMPIPAKKVQAPVKAEAPVVEAGTAEVVEVVEEAEAVAAVEEALAAEAEVVEEAEAVAAVEEAPAAEAEVVKDAEAVAAVEETPAAEAEVVEEAEAVAAVEEAPAVEAEVVEDADAVAAVDEADVAPATEAEETIEETEEAPATEDEAIVAADEPLAAAKEMAPDEPEVAVAE